MEVFDYEDSQLIPNKCIVTSRSECDTRIQFGPHTFKIPVVPANMQTVINEELAIWFAENQYFYIMHRFDEAARKPFVRMMKERGLEYAGADATKVGIGSGRICITKLKTGFGTGGWQLAALCLCAKAARKPIIADDGIRHNGDIAKSVRFGASMVMIGSLLAAHEASPEENREIDGKLYKEYFDSASEFQKGERKNVEDKKEMIPARGKLSDTLEEMQQDLQSSISYAGGKDLDAIRKVAYVIVRNTVYNGDR